MEKKSKKKLQIKNKWSSPNLHQNINKIQMKIKQK